MASPLIPLLTFWKTKTKGKTMIQQITQFGKKIFGTQNDRELKTLYPLVQRVNDLESKIKLLSNNDLKAQTAKFRQRIANGEPLNSILPEAFATVREAAWRQIGQRHYDVQLIGGMTLHKGRIAEMKTGEGKTLVATLPCYLNALEGKGVHVITVNDYLAKRDSEWMNQIYSFLGMSTGIIVHGLNDQQRQHNYRCDITYGTNNEFGFDYLRDNMKFRLEDYAQRELNFAIIDEVDSILIDEARTPLIISGPSEDSTELYYAIDRQIRSDGGLEKDADYSVDEKTKTAVLLEPGVDKMEKRLGVKNLYDPSNIEILHHVNQALRAHVLFKRDVDYVVKDGEVCIVDEFTGRLMAGRRWSDGLHQAVEAKEGVEIESENQTLATITFQNFFRMYNKLSGMTGTADTEATEFKQIYNLDVTIIPTNRPNVRKDEADVIYKSETAKTKAIIQEIKAAHTSGVPVLVGTVSVEKSEVIAEALKKEGVRHNVLNAKQHQREAEIVAQAGRKGSVTISTNMAGRGTDILLGGNAEFLAKAETGPAPTLETNTPEGQAEYETKMNEWKQTLETNIQKWNEMVLKDREEIKKLGGLYIVGTERHESRRIDNQLRGRAGRQGDPGKSKFYLSLDDDLMRIFGGVNIKKFMEDDLPIEHPWITKAIANAQKKVEGHNYDIRKHLLEYDDVMNQQRKVIYSMRREVLSQNDLRPMVMSMASDIILAISEDFFPGGKIKRIDGESSLNLKELNEAIAVTFQVRAQLTEGDIQPLNGEGLKKILFDLTEKAYQAKENQYSPDLIRQVEKMVLLGTIDQLWKDHLLAMDHMRDGIGLQGYGQKDPLVEYKKQGFKFFEMMMNQITGDVVRKMFAVQISTTNEMPEQETIHEAPVRNPIESLDPTYSPDTMSPFKGVAQASASGRGSQSRGSQGGPTSQLPGNINLSKVGRNDVCPCGSGKKFKRCHGSHL